MKNHYKEPGAYMDSDLDKLFHYDLIKMPPMVKGGTDIYGVSVYRKRLLSEILKDPFIEAPFNRNITKDSDWVKIGRLEMHSHGIPAGHPMLPQWLQEDAKKLARGFVRVWLARLHEDRDKVWKRVGPSFSEMPKGLGSLHKEFKK